MAPPHVAMNWARRLKRVFRIDTETCARCGGTLEIIASIEKLQVVDWLLSHLQHTAQPPDPAGLPLGARTRRRPALAQHPPGESDRRSR